MINLYTTKPSRLFTFGCSFTKYKWATWANILALDLNCEFYNFGRSGSGNFYISQAISQVDSIYNFSKDDLVIVCWTNISREDRWTTNQGWLTPGNIYSQDMYDKKFMKRWSNEIHFALRDFSYIKLIDEFLKHRTQYHFLSMCDIKTMVNQWSNVKNNDVCFEKLVFLYKKNLDKILPSYYNVLWNNDINYKIKLDKKIIHENFVDGHPTIIEHFNYLQKIFDYDFNKTTVNIVEQSHNDCIDYIKFNKIKFITDSHLSKQQQEEMLIKFSIKESKINKDNFIL